MVFLNYIVYTLAPIRTCGAPSVYKRRKKNNQKTSRAERAIW